MDDGRENGAVDAPHTRPSPASAGALAPRDGGIGPRRRTDTRFAIGDRAHPPSGHVLTPCNQEGTTIGRRPREHTGGRAVSRLSIS